MSGFDLSRRKFLKWLAAVTTGMVMAVKAPPAKTASAAQKPDILNPVPVNEGTVSASSDAIPPTVTGILPASVSNDLDTPIVITGADFTSVVSEQLVLISPTVSLGSTALTQVTWVDSGTLTASVPWGVDPGLYPLTVVNPDQSTGSLANALTVSQGIGKWNGGNLFGGEVNRVLIKPGAPDTLYAAARGCGLFRSDDAGEHWLHVNADLAVNGKFATDPLHPDWLYGYDYRGLHRSQDKGNTWTLLMPNIWPDGRSANFPQVYVSPYDPQVLFVSSSLDYGNPNAGEAYGLIKSTDGGNTWEIVASMEGRTAQTVAFHPTDSARMVLATSYARVFQSSDAGDTWSEVLKPPLSGIGLGGVITYNPYRPAEVWVASVSPAGVYKSTDAVFSQWQNMTSADGMGSFDVKFTSADSVYITKHHSIDGGLTWEWFGPIYAYGEISFNPNDLQIGYLGDDTYGVQKTTDGGQTWEVKNQGLTGMICRSMEVSRADPLRVYAAFGGSPGIYRSDDGVISWNYLPVPTTNGVFAIREDPFDPQRLYVAADGFIVSTDGGKNWSDLGWNLPPGAPSGMRWGLETDPFQAGHLLLGMVSGSYGLGTGWLYRSSNYGVSWEAVTVPQELAWTSDIAFDPETPGLVYLTTGGTGIYRSTNSGASWERIGDPQQPDLQYIATIAVARHPQNVLFVGANFEPFRSFDGGATWEKAQNSPGGVSNPTFINGDSTRLYVATGFGLYLSRDMGDTWTQAAGSLGQLQIQALGYATVNGQTVLYAATTGGDLGATGSLLDNTTPKTLATNQNLVDAGIYRYVQRTWKNYLPLVKR